MSFLAAALPAIGSVVGGIISSRGARRAANAEVQAAQLGIDEQRRQYDTTRADLAPWRLAGEEALGQQMSLLGLGGDQQAVIDMLLASPQFSSLSRQGNEAILQSASATGGLRGGNNISNLANFRTDLLARLIDRQLGNLGGISGAGMQSATSLGQFGANSASAIAELLGRQGSARAGGAVGQANAWNGAISGVLQSLPGMLKVAGLPI